MPTYSHATYITKRTAAAAVSAELDLLRTRCGQEGDLSTDLNHLFSMHDPKLRQPLIVLLRENDRLEAAVFFFERRFAGLGTGFCRVGDQTGDGSVLAMPGDRERALRCAIDLLMTKWRVHTIAGALSESSNDEAEVWSPQGRRVVTQTVVRSVKRRMAILSTYEETLMQLGSHMRKKVRASRRKAEKQFDLEFVSELSSEMAEEAFTTLATRSLPLRSKVEIDERCAFLRTRPEAYCSGLRVRNGDWLALASGWRTQGSTYISWQIHNQDFKAQSLSYLFRSFLLEQEAARHQKEFVWIGGTNERWQRPCRAESCLFVLRRRRGLRSHALKLLATFVLPDSCYHICDPPTRAPSTDSDREPVEGWRNEPMLRLILAPVTKGVQHLQAAVTSFWRHILFFKTALPASLASDKKISS